MAPAQKSEAKAKDLRETKRSDDIDQKIAYFR